MPPWEAFGASHIGGRDENQDDYAILAAGGGWELLAVVADGMGGHQGGADASQLAVAVARDVWAGRGKDRPLTELLAELVAAAHERIRALNGERGTDSQTTLAALWLRGDETASVHVGDSRILQFGVGGLVERTRDHSMAQLHLMAGRLTEEEMAGHPDQAKLLTSVGGPAAPELEIVTWDPARGGGFVVCSDGFWEIVPPEAQGALLRASSPQRALEEEIHRRLETAPDDHDNTTAVLIRRMDFGSAGGTGKRVLVAAALAVVVLAAIGVAAALFTGWPAAGDAPAPVETKEAPAKPDGTKPSDSAKGSPEGDETFPPPAREEKVPRGEPEGADGIVEGEAVPPKKTEAGEGVAGEETAPFERTEHTVDIEWQGEAGPAEVAERLREAGILGELDDLEIRTEGTGGGARVVRLEVTHDGLPVWGSVLTGRVEEGRVVELSGYLPRDIVLPNEPRLSFPDAVTRAVAEADEAFEPLGEGVLHIVYLADGSYTRAWHGTVRGEQDWRVLVDAHTGRLLKRWPRGTEQPRR